MRKLKGKPKNISWGIEDNDSTILTNKDDILERWAKFYEDIGMTLQLILQMIPMKTRFFLYSTVKLNMLFII